MLPLETYIPLITKILTDWKLTDAKYQFLLAACLLFVSLAMKLIFCLTKSVLLSFMSASRNLWICLH